MATAADGSIWFAQQNLIARISPGGAILKQYPISEARAIAVASDGALWYSRLVLGPIVGRIAGNVPTEFTSPTQSWSLASAGNGGMWVLGNGFGMGLDRIYLMTPAGTVTALPLGTTLCLAVLSGTAGRYTLHRYRTHEQSPSAGARRANRQSCGSFGKWVFIRLCRQYLVWRERDAALPRQVGSAESIRADAWRPSTLHRPPRLQLQAVAIDPTGGSWSTIVDETVQLDCRPPVKSRHLHRCRT